MSLAEPDVLKDENVTREDPVAVWLDTEIPNPEEVILEKPLDEESSPRVCAERAIRKFQSLIFSLPYDQAKEAYARLIVPRGFDKTSPPANAEARGKPPVRPNAAGHPMGPNHHERKGFFQFLREQVNRRQG